MAVFTWIGGYGTNGKDDESDADIIMSITGHALFAGENGVKLKETGTPANARINTKHAYRISSYQYVLTDDDHKGFVENYLEYGGTASITSAGTTTIKSGSGKAVVELTDDAVLTVDAKKDIVTGNISMYGENAKKQPQATLTADGNITTGTITLRNGSNLTIHGRTKGQIKTSDVVSSGSASLTVRETEGSIILADFSMRDTSTATVTASKGDIKLLNTNLHDGSSMQMYAKDGSVIIRNVDVAYNADGTWAWFKLTTEQTDTTDSNVGNLILGNTQDINHTGTLNGQGKVTLELSGSLIPTHGKSKLVIGAHTFDAAVGSTYSFGRDLGTKDIMILVDVTEAADNKLQIVNVRDVFVRGIQDYVAGLTKPVGYDGNEKDALTTSDKQDGYVDAKTTLQTAELSERINALLEEEDPDIRAQYVKDLTAMVNDLVYLPYQLAYEAAKKAAEEAAAKEIEETGSTSIEIPAELLKHEILRNYIAEALSENNLTDEQITIALTLFDEVAQPVKDAQTALEERKTEEAAALTQKEEKEQAVTDATTANTKAQTKLGELEAAKNSTAKAAEDLAAEKANELLAAQTTEAEAKAAFEAASEEDDTYAELKLAYEEAQAATKAIQDQLDEANAAEEEAKTAYDEYLITATGLATALTTVTDEAADAAKAYAAAQEATRKAQEVLDKEIVKLNKYDETGMYWTALQGDMVEEPASDDGDNDANNAADTDDTAANAEEQPAEPKERILSDEVRNSIILKLIKDAYNKKLDGSKADENGQVNEEAAKEAAKNADVVDTYASAVLTAEEREDLNEQFEKAASEKAAQLQENMKPADPTPMIIKIDQCNGRGINIDNYGDIEVLVQNGDLHVGIIETNRQDLTPGTTATGTVKLEATAGSIIGLNVTDVEGSRKANVIGETITLNAAGSVQNMWVDEIKKTYKVDSQVSEELKLVFVGWDEQGNPIYQAADDDADADNSDDANVDNGNDAHADTSDDTASTKNNDAAKYNAQAYADYTGYYVFDTEAATKINVTAGTGDIEITEISGHMGVDVINAVGDITLTTGAAISNGEREGQIKVYPLSRTFLKQ